MKPKKNTVLGSEVIGSIRSFWRRIVFVVVAAFTFSVVTAGLYAAAAIAGTVWKPIGPSPISEPTAVPDRIQSERARELDRRRSDQPQCYLSRLGRRRYLAERQWRQHLDAIDRSRGFLGIGSSHAIAVDPGNPNTLSRNDLVRSVQLRVCRGQSTSHSRRAF